MTEVRFYSFKGKLTGFEISDHSGFDDEGSDIVCAAISSCAYMVINTITDIIGVQAEVEVDEAYISFSVSEKDADRISDIMQGFEMHVKALADDYKDFIVCKKENIQ